MKYSVKASSFVKRQTEGSGKTFSETLSFDEIASIAQENINNRNYTEGYRDGVIITTLNKDISLGFTCPLVRIDKNTKLAAKMVTRRENEDPYIQIRALNGQDLVTSTVDLILYRKDVLSETNENSTNADWELIAFMAKPKNVKMPMGPITMMRNQLQKKGGTKGEYSSNEWAKSVEFWQEYAIKE